MPPWLRGPLRRYWASLPLFGPTAPVAPDYLKRLRKAGVRPTRAHAISRFGDPRSVMTRTLQIMQASPAMGSALHAAAHGMEFMQPYHDKRVVELGLAIPPDLYVKDGRNRHLARTTLQDIYPPEFQRRGSENDEWVPDYAEMIERVRPRVLTEIERMQKEGRLSRYYDFDRMRAMLTGRPGKAPSQQAVWVAVRSFLHASYIEWFQRDNRPEP